jgi:hypothetical protein
MYSENWPRCACGHHTSDTDCLAAFDKAVRRRAQWYGRRDMLTGVRLVDAETGKDLETSRVALEIDISQPR